jgi:hypothetical protein
MAEIEERLRRLEDEAEVLRTLYAYGSSIDYGREDEFRNCWTETAVLVWGKTPYRELPDFPVRRFEGIDAIVDAFRVHTHAPERFHKHLLHQPRLTIDGDQATVESLFTRLDESPEGPVIRSFGRYRDVLVRCHDGRWRFELREAEVESMVPQRTG